MASHVIFENKSDDGVGNKVTNSGKTAVYAITLNGTLDGAFARILVDLKGGEDWIPAGTLSSQSPAKLLILPEGASCNARLLGCKADTSATVVIS